MSKVQPKIEISLTDFVDFVCKTGAPKQTKVQEVKNRGEYSPLTDFYRGLRKGIIENHKNLGTKKDLENIIQGITDPKKIENYKEAVAGYSKFWGRKNIRYFEPPFKHWHIGNMDIRLNPELGLEYNGEFYIIKLYLKNDNLTKDRINHILTLMESELRNQSEPEVKMAILDVKKGKIHIKQDNNLTLMPLLQGEASSFEVIWNNI